MWSAIVANEPGNKNTPVKKTNNNNNNNNNDDNNNNNNDNTFIYSWLKKEKLNKLINANWSYLFTFSFIYILRNYIWIPSSLQYYF